MFNAVVGVALYLYFYLLATWDTVLASFEEQKLTRKEGIVIIVLCVSVPEIPRYTELEALKCGVL